MVTIYLEDRNSSLMSISISLEIYANASGHVWDEKSNDGQCPCPISVVKLAGFLLSWQDEIWSSSQWQAGWGRSLWPQPQHWELCGMCIQLWALPTLRWTVSTYFLYFLIYWSCLMLSFISTNYLVVIIQCPLQAPLPKAVGEKFPAASMVLCNHTLSSIQSELYDDKESGPLLPLPINTSRDVFFQEHSCYQVCIQQM